MSLTERQQKILAWIDAGNNADVMNYAFDELIEKELGGITMQTAMKDVRHLHSEGWVRRITSPTGIPYAGCASWVRSYLSRK